MKTINIIIICFIAALSFVRCTTRNSFDYKVTLVPLASSVTMPGDVPKASGVISKRVENFFKIPTDRIESDIYGNQIQLTISSIDTGKVGQVKKVITCYNKLEFWETYENAEIIGNLKKVNEMLRETGNPAGKDFKSQNPLFTILSPRVKDNGEPLPSCMIGLVNEKDTSTINMYFKMEQVKALLPGDIKFYLSAFPYEYDDSKTLYELHAIKMTTGHRNAPLNGSSIISAQTVQGTSDSDVKISLTLDSAGTRSWAKMTSENIKRCIAVVYDGHVRSYPRVMSEISGGSMEITGDFTMEEATDLVNILKSGDLPYAIRITQEQIIKRE